MDQSSKVIKCYKENQLIEPLYVARERGKNIIICVDFSKTCDVFKSFTELKQDIEIEDIKFPL